MTAEIRAAMEKLQAVTKGFPEGLEQCEPAIPVTINGYDAQHWHGGDFYVVELTSPKRKDMVIEPYIEQLQKFHEQNLLSYRRVTKGKYIIVFNRFVEENRMVEINGSKVRFIRMPDDVLALRIEAGGNPVVKQFYIKHKGNLSDILDMLELLAEGAREAMRSSGTYVPRNIILS